MIEEICQQYKIVNYSINPDQSIDVDGTVNLSNKGLTKLPLKFNRVSGDFDCYDNKLTTLEGSPKSVGGDFYSFDNQLTTLEGSPKSVGGLFSCSYNQLTSLEGCPSSVGGSFNCGNNEITDLKGFNTDFKGMFYCINSPIGLIFDKVEQDFTNWFKQLKIGENNLVDLKRLKYLQTIFDFRIDLEQIKKNYKIV